MSLNKSTPSNLLFCPVEGTAFYRPEVLVKCYSSRSLFFRACRTCQALSRPRNFLILRKGPPRAAETTAIASDTDKALGRPLRTPPPAQLLSCHPPAPLEQMCSDHVLCRQQAVSGYDCPGLLLPRWPSPRAQTIPPHSPPPLCTLPCPAASSLAYARFVSGAALP